MASDREYAWFSGLDKSYSSRKRALVLRGHVAQKAASKSVSKARVLVPQQNHPSRRSRRQEVSESDAERDRPSLQALVRTELDGQGDYDPFNCTIPTKDQRSKYLITHYLTIPPELYDTGPNNGRLQAVFFTEMMHDELSMTVVKYMGAAHLAAQSRSLVAKREAFEYRGKIISEVNERMTDLEMSSSDSTIVGIIPLLSGAISQHAAGLAQLLAKRGGFRTLPPWLDWMLHWVDIQAGGEVSVNLANIQGLQNVTTGSNGLPLPLAFCLDDFVHFYAKAFLSAIARGALTEPFAGTIKQKSISSFYKALPEQAMAKNDHTRVAVLLFTNLMMCGDLNDLAQPPVEDLSDRLLKEHLLHSKQPWLGLLSLCLSDDGTPRLDNRERAELVARYLYVYKRLTWHLQLRVETALMDLLVMDGEEGVAVLWTPEQLREALLADLQLEPNEPGSSLGTRTPQYVPASWTRDWRMASLDDE